jgi:hypothetical protein
MCTVFAEPLSGGNRGGQVSITLIDLPPSNTRFTFIGKYDSSHEYRLCYNGWKEKLIKWWKKRVRDEDKK